MAAKEKKSTINRQLSKENLTDKEKIATPDTLKKRTRARKPVGDGVQPKKRIVRKKQAVPLESPKLTPQKSGRKTFLEKELEDILENATGRNTPSDAERSTPSRRRDELITFDSPLFVPKIKREIDDDNISERSLTTFLRARKGGDREIEDDLLSLRSVKLRKDDEDTASVRSLPAKKVTKKNISLAPIKPKPVRVKKNVETKPPPKKRVPKAKDAKQTAKKQIKFPNKVGAQRRSNLLIKKKVRNAQNAVKRIYKKKASLNDADTRGKISAAETNGEVSVKVKTPRAKAAPIKRVPVKRKKVASSKQNAELGMTVTPKMTANENMQLPAKAAEATSKRKPQKRRRGVGELYFETTRSPNDSSVIIVQPRLGPKMRRKTKATVDMSQITLALPSAPPNVVPVLSHVVPNGSPASTIVGPVSPSAATNSNNISASTLPSSSHTSLTCAPPISSPTGCSSSLPVPSSTPYFIQTMPSFNALKSQANVQGDWLVTPTGVVLIQAVTPGDRGPRVENLEAMSTSLTPVVSPPPSGSASAQTDSALSEKAKEAEAAQGVAIPVTIPVAKNVSDLLLLKSQMEELTSSVVDTATSKDPSPVNNRNVVGSTERRASHDGSFGPTPCRLVSRARSCERLLTRSPRSILQLGSEPLPINDVVRLFETDSSFSLRVPLHVPSPISSSHSSPTRMIGSTSDLVTNESCTGPDSVELEPESQSEIQTDSTEVNSENRNLQLIITSSSSPTCPTPPASPTPAPSSVLESTVTENVIHDIVGEIAETEKVISIDVSATEPICVPEVEQIVGLKKLKPFSEDKDRLAVAGRRCHKDDLRGVGRTKKYSRSLDSRQKLLPGIRRRSHPEPRIINIVTCEDGSRQGQPVVEEFRQQCAREALLDGEGSQVPYHHPSPESPSKPILNESPEELASKETILSALGLQSLKAAAESAQKKKERAPASINNTSSINNYTGTLKTVIKIQRPEKKGNGRMIYKASSAAGAGPESTVAEEDIYPDGASSTKESLESGDEDGKNGNGKAKALVIPEKASSFSIHPHRMCSDVCTYCFGKFGLLDTPCHVAQLKDSEKRRNILASETHLTLDSCLCDACFRHVDKKSNCPSFTEKKPNKRKLLPRKVVLCCVVSCDNEAQHNVRRKSLLKLKKSLGKKLLLDQNKVDKLQPANMVTLCDRHIYWVDYFMSCGICSRRLATMHMYRVGPETLELNTALGADGIPTVVTEKRFLCKLCQYYASIRLKVKHPSEMTSSQRQFYESCRRRILQGHGLEVPDSEPEVDVEPESHTKVAKSGKSVKKLKPSATVTNGVDEENERERKNDNVRKVESTNCEDFADLRAKFKAHPAPASGFHKCSTTIQFTAETKNLFYDLQRPYGNHSSFLRHLILLEKYFRNGDLVVSRNATPQAVKYVNGVQNRLRSYDGVPQVSSRPFTLTPVPTSSSAPVTASSAPPAPPSASSTSTCNPLTQMQATVQNIGLKPDISIMSVGQEPRKLTPKIQENLRALANRSSKPTGQTRAVILNRTVGGQKQSLVQVTTGGKTIHLTLSQFRRIQQMQLRKKQMLENQIKTKGKVAKVNGPSEGDSSSFPNIPKALSVSVTKVPAVDLTKSSPTSD